MSSRPPLFDMTALEQTMVSFAARLDRHRSELNRLNVYPLPDGDTGDNLAATLDSVLAHVAKAKPDGGVVNAVATGALLGGRGSSGVILGQGLCGFVTSLPDNTCGAADLAAALTAAAAAAREAIADPVEGTILTVADDAARQAQAAASAGESLAEVARAAAEEGWRSLARTPDLLPALARAGVVDAGGFGYVLFLDALLEAITGEERPRPRPEAPVLQVTTADAGAHAKPSSGRYEVLCMLAADQGELQALRERWSDLGDTVAIAGIGDTWRGHVHTDDVLGALAAARQAGEVSHVEITDLFAAQDGPAPERGLHTGAPDGSAVSVIAVAEGDGLVAAYLEAGARRVVLGGITEKPSTGELLRVVDACASPVVVLPGDQDVLPAARRAAQLAAVPARVVPTDMLAGLLALEAVGPGVNGDADSEAAQLQRASRRIHTARIQRAVRESTTELGKVRVGEWLAKGAAGLVASGATASEALDRAAAVLIGPGTRRALVTVDQEAPETGNAVADLRRIHPHVQWLQRRTNRPSCAYGIAVW